MQQPHHSELSEVTCFKTITSTSKGVKVPTPVHGTPRSARPSHRASSLATSSYGRTYGSECHLLIWVVEELEDRSGDRELTSVSSSPFFEKQTMMSLQHWRCSRPRGSASRRRWDWTCKLSTSGSNYCLLIRSTLDLSFDSELQLEFYRLHEHRLILWVWAFFWLHALSLTASLVSLWLWICCWH